MDDYRSLGTRYLQQNKRRQIITILGCMIVAACLYAFLNFMCNWIEAERIRVRNENDYEIMILSDDKAKLEAIANEDFIRSAYIGKESKDEIVYANALHINVKNVFFVNYYDKYIQQTYDVETRPNYELLWTYCIDRPDNPGIGLGYLVVLVGIFYSYIFAIIGVGIIKNSIELAALERIKDFGNLRCIGATKKQIKQIVFREGFTIETIGIVCGILFGYAISVPFCSSRDYPIGFHFLPILFIAITFYGDLYFTIGDSVKQIIKASPVEALRGNFRIKQRGLKRRGKTIWTILFGIEGDYAYKNIRRNSGRFIKTVIAMSFGLGTVVFVSGELAIFSKYYKSLYGNAGFYQQYLENDTFGVKSDDEIKADIYSPEAIKTISSTKGVGASKYIYKDTLYFTEDALMYSKMNKEYEEKADCSIYRQVKWNEIRNISEDEWEASGKKYNYLMKSYRDSGKGLVDYEALEVIGENSDDSKNIRDNNFASELDGTQISIYGYDAEDYARYRDHLVEGTTELSENGVLLMNYANLFLVEDVLEWEESDAMFVLPERKNYKLTDLKLGDEITIVDPVLMDELIKDELKNAKAYDQKMHQKKDAWDSKHAGELDENGKEKDNPYDHYMDITDSTYLKCRWIIESARQKLIEEGHYKTYVIEGIVDSDPNRFTEEPVLIAPLDNYFSITGKTENDYVGVHFHISNIFSPAFSKEEFQRALREKDINVEDVNYTYTIADKSTFIDDITDAVSSIKILIIFCLVIVLVVLVSALNTMNASISNLQLRKNEFAQLRAIGMTKKSLTKTALLEGGIVWFISSVIGIVFGFIVQYFIYTEVLVYMIGTELKVSWLPILIAMILEFLVLCGTNILCIRDMNLNVASELTRSGD